MVSRLLRKRVKELIDETEEDLVNHREIRGEREHGDNHYQGGCANLLPGRPRHAAHLGLQLSEVILHPERPSGGPLDEIPLVAFLNLCGCHVLKISSLRVRWQGQRD